MQGGTFRGDELGAIAAVELGTIDLLSRGVIAASPFCVMTIVAGRGVEILPLTGPIGFVKVPSHRSVVAPYPAGLGGRDHPAHGTEIGLTFFVPGMDACLHVRGRTAEVAGEHARALTIAVEEASLCSCPVVLLPNSGPDFETIADVLPRFRELVSRPSIRGNGYDTHAKGFDRAG